MGITLEDALIRLRTICMNNERCKTCRIRHNALCNASPEDYTEQDIKELSDFLEVEDGNDDSNMDNSIV